MTNSLPNHRPEVAEGLRNGANSETLPLILNVAFAAFTNDGYSAITVTAPQAARRLADLIDPTCTAIVDETHDMDDELVCSSCGCTLGFIVDNQPPTLTKYCPSCGSRIVREVE